MFDTGNTENIRNGKALLRARMLKERRSLSEEERNRMSRTICERFLACPEYERSATILLYKAYNCEVDTDLIFERAISDGKMVAYPVSKIVDGVSLLTFYVVNSPDQFKEGYKGIPEPDTDKGCDQFKGAADVCIAPGVAFDRKCNRIGYGKAFYDTYIRQNRPGTVIGLAYDVQVSDGFEPEECDIPVDIVITETAVYRRR